MSKYAEEIGLRREVLNNTRSPAYDLLKIIEKRVKRLEDYRVKENANNSFIEINEKEINALNDIHDRIVAVEPYWSALLEISKILHRDIALDVDIACILIPLKDKLPPYNTCNIEIKDLSDYGIKTLADIRNLHLNNIACVEVDDLTENNVNDVITLAEDRGTTLNIRSK